MARVLKALFVLALNQEVFAASPNADEIAMKAFLASKVSDSISDSTFTLINEAGQERKRETTGSSKLIKGTTDNRRLVVFKSPSDVKGTKTLLIEHANGDDDMWIYLPALKKVRRLVSSDKKSSFVGTDFSYGDVIGHRVADWNHKILGEKIVDGKACWEMESTPKSKDIAENSGYSKRKACIDKESFVMLEGLSFDLDGKELKKFKSTNIEKVDAKNEKWQPMRIEAENLQTKHRTVIEFKNYKVNQGVSDDLFTTRSLEKQ